MDPVAEPVSVPCGDADLPGYFIAPGDGQASRKTLIMIGGGDTYVEDLYLIIGPAAVKRGYNLLIVDLPGQGGLPFDGLYMRPDTENQILAVVDYAFSPAGGRRRRAGRLRDQLRRVHPPQGAVG